MSEKYKVIESDVEIPISDIEIFHISCKPDLVDSIKNHGMLVRPKLFKLDESDDKYMIDDGRRRLSVAKHDLDWDSVRCDIVNVDGILSSLIYNFQRSPNPMMEARHLHELIEGRGYTQKELAHELGCTQSKISKRLGLLNLIDELQDKLEGGKLPKSVGYELSKLSGDKQREIAESEGPITLKDVKEEKRLEVVENLDMERIEEPEDAIVLPSPVMAAPTGDELHEIPDGEEVYAELKISKDGGTTRLEIDGNNEVYKMLYEYFSWNDCEIVISTEVIDGVDTLE